MGQLLTWIRGPRDDPAMQSVTVEKQSQPSKATPSPPAQVSAEKPAQFEKKSSAGSVMATKPGVVNTATGGATGSGMTARGSASLGTAGQVAKSETNTTPAGASVIDMSSAGATVVDMGPPGERGGPEEMSETNTMPAGASVIDMSSAGATVVDMGPPGERGGPEEMSESASVVTTVKAGAPKIDPAKTPQPAALAMPAAGNVSMQETKAKPTQTQVQVEVPPTKGAKEAPIVDPFDALASILPPAEPVAPPQPVYTGPEVEEHDITSEIDPKCGEREDTLPPGYRFEDMAPIPADVKPKDVPKPMSRDEALDSLSAGFMASAAPPATAKQEKKDQVDRVSASSAGPANFAPPPVKKSQPPSAAPPLPVCQAPPVDKKAKMGDFSLEVGLPPSSKETVFPVAVCPPADKKARMEETPELSLKSDPLPLDAFSALGDLLPEAKPKPELPELRPEDVVPEDKHKKEKGVIVGERDDTLPPEYRFNEEELKKLPPPKPEPTMGTADALEFLSEGFMTPSAAPAVQAPAPPAKKAPAVPPVEEAKVEKVSGDFSLEAGIAPPTGTVVECFGAPPAPKCPAPTLIKEGEVKKVSDDFSLLAGIAPSTGTVVECFGAPPAPKCPAPTLIKEGEVKKVSDDFSLLAGIAPSTGTVVECFGAPVLSSSQDDALGALGDLLPEAKPKPELPELRPEDIVSEGKHKKEKGVIVGERDDTLPPEYRFNEEELKKLPPPKPEPTIGTDDALNFLSGDLATSSAAPAVQAPVLTPSAPPAQVVECFGTPPAPKCPAPTLIKEGEVKKVSDDFSLQAGIAPSTGTVVECFGAPPAPRCPAPTLIKEGEVKKVSDDFSLQAGIAPSTGTVVECFGAPVLSSSQDDALGALGDLLPEAKPKPELPELRPEDIVSEDKHKKEKGVIVGERDDTLPPEYRFNEEELKKLPPPKPEPTMGTADALEFLSEGFMTPSAAPAVQAPAPTPIIPPPQIVIEDLAAVDELSGDFVAQPTASGVQASAPPSTKKAAEDDPLSPDAFSALSDMLPDDKPKPELPELRPEDVVSEDKFKEEEGVLVGLREDSIPPEYRFKEEELKKLPPLKPEPTMGTSDALEFLSGDLKTSSAAPAVQTQAAAPSAPPAQPSLDSALDALSGEFVCAAAAPAVQSACVATATAPQMQAEADSAMDALSDTLMDVTPTPKPAPVPVKDVVKEKKIVEERLIKMGEKDDTLPPEYRLTEEERKKMEEAQAQDATKPKETMDEKTALELLSDDFRVAPEATAAAASCAATTKVEPPALDSGPLKPMAGPVLDSLSSTLLPDAPEFKPKTDKPKGKKSKSRSKKHHTEEPSAADQPSARQTSDVVPASTKKGGKS